MQMLWKCALLVVIPTGMALAQEQNLSIPEGTTVKLILLRQKSVQKELKLTPDEIKKIVEFTHTQHEAAVKALQLTEDERKDKFAAMEKENKKFLADNLKPAQKKRLDQITMQLTGLTQLTRKEIIQELKLTKEQVAKVKKLQKEARKTLAKLFDAKDAADRNEKLAKLREETRNNIMDLLTEEQRVIARRMVGEPFTGELEFETESEK